MSVRRCVLSAVLGCLAVVATTSLISCSGAQLSNMWHDPTFNSGPMTNVLIIAMKQKPLVRRNWEDGFVMGLSENGARATPSYQLFPNALPDTDAVVQAVKEHGYDGVLILHRQETSLSTRDVPGYTTNEPVTRYNPWLKSYRTYFREVYHPGYTETEKEVSHQVDVWTTQEGSRMVWAGTVTLTDPESPSDVRKSVVGKIVPELADKGIVPKK